MLFLLQTDLTGAAADAMTAEEGSEITLSFFELAIKGGWVMIPIVLLSIVAIYIFFERPLPIVQESHCKND
jgi:biopolymer transport protein ExbB